MKTLPNCIDCGNKVASHTTKRCRNCNTKIRQAAAQANDPDWVEIALCQKCGKKLKGHTSKLCKACCKILPDAHCADCGALVSAPHVKRCFRCEKEYKGKLALEKNSNFRSDPTCIDCGVKLNNKYASRCADCYHKTTVGAGNGRWNPETVCSNCGNRVSASHVTLCLKCKRLSEKGLPKCKSCGENLSKHNLLKDGTGYCRACYKGDKTRVWNPTLTAEERIDRRNLPGYGDWRNQVFEKDKHTCQKCGFNGGNLIAHHVYNWRKYPDLRFDVSNGATLCKICHNAFHREYGNKHNTREQFEDFLRLPIKP